MTTTIQVLIQHAEALAGTPVANTAETQAQATWVLAFATLALAKIQAQFLNDNPPGCTCGCGGR